MANYLVPCGHTAYGGSYMLTDHGIMRVKPVYAIHHNLKRFIDEALGALPNRTTRNLIRQLHGT